MFILNLKRLKSEIKFVPCRNPFFRILIIIWQLEITLQFGASNWNLSWNFTLISLIFIEMTINDKLQGMISVEIYLIIEKPYICMTLFFNYLFNIFLILASSQKWWRSKQMEWYCILLHITRTSTATK